MSKWMGVAVNLHLSIQVPRCRHQCCREHGGRTDHAHRQGRPCKGEDILAGCTCAGENLYQG